MGEIGGCCKTMSSGADSLLPSIWCGETPASRRSAADGRLAASKIPSVEAVSFKRAPVRRDTAHRESAGVRATASVVGLVKDDGAKQAGQARLSGTSGYVGVLHRHGVRWCRHDLGAFTVPVTKQSVTSKAKRNSAPRASVTFPPELYEMLEAIARSKKVSVAWVVREAAERYVAEQWPLLGRPQ